MTVLYAVETNASIGTTQIIAAEALGFWPGMNESGRLGTEVYLDEEGAGKVEARLTELGYQVFVTRHSG